MNFIEKLGEESSNFNHFKESRFFFPSNYFIYLLMNSIKEALENGEEKREYLIRMLEEIFLPAFAIPGIFSYIEAYYLDLWNREELDGEKAQFFNDISEAILPEIYNELRNLHQDEAPEFRFGVAGDTTLGIELPVKKSWLDKSNNVIKEGTKPVSLTFHKGLIEFFEPTGEKLFYYERDDVMFFLIFNGQPFVCFNNRYECIGGMYGHSFATTLPVSVFTSSNEKTLKFIVKELL